MPEVDSSAIARIRYDRRSRELSVTFVGSGNTYTYIGVPRSEYEALLAAPSKGRHYNAFIRDRYPFRR